MSDRVLRFSSCLFGWLTAFLFAALASGQILGFIGFYRPPVVLISTFLLTLLAGWAYFKFSGNVFWQSLFSERTKTTRLECFFFLAGFLLLILILIPVALWPYTPISETLTWDAGLYHFPKAVEMFSSGSAWDLSISYGEYPFGYETLLSLCFCLTHSGILFGLLHALIGLYFFLCLWLLACRYSRLPSWLLFLASALLMASGFLPFESNPWWILRYLLQTIGKNDLFLAAAMLSLALHAPLGTANNQAYSHPFGLAYSAMLTLSIKANGALLVLFLGVLTLLHWWKNRREIPPLRRLPYRLLLFLVLLALPGVLWAIRNLIANGRLVSSDVLNLNRLSIAANLTNPFFYQHIPQHLILITAFALLCLALALWKQRPTLTIAAVFVILLLSFLITPATAFPYRSDEPAQIAWRFAIALLAWMFLATLNLFDPWLTALYDRVQKRSWLLGAAGISCMLFSLWLIFDNRSLFIPNPSNEIVLHDQFRQSVGTDGYFSAYDYVQKNIHHAVIHVDNGLPFYLYDSAFTNSVTYLRPAQYYVVFRTAWYDGMAEEYPDQVNDPAWQTNWQLIYEDSQGRVYQRIQTP